jgi:NADH-ubiquinone oxidoreductase chain 6
MYSLYIIIEQSCNGYRIEILNLISFMSVLTGVFVIITKNPIISILFLICLFLSIACYLILLGISYIGLSYLLVYIGAISILFLFILMLIDIRISELQSETTNSLALALILGSCFYYIVQGIIPQGSFINNVFFNSIDFNSENLFFVTSGS